MLINHYKKIKPKEKVLDIGIGQGKNAFFLLNKGCFVHGIDPSKQTINTLSGQILKQKLNLKVFHTRFSEFKFKEKTYDAILIFGLIQILSEKKIEILVKKISVCLKKGGLIFLTGFTKQESGFMPKTEQCKKLSESYFTDKNGNFRTFKCR